jgi:hypothetical protein
VTECPSIVNSMVAASVSGFVAGFSPILPHSQFVNLPVTDRILP